MRDKNGNWIKYVNGVMTQEYQVWYSMNERCIEGGRIQRLYTTYQGCWQSAGFVYFEQFADWYEKQIGYGLSNYDLDKDILFENNKCYSEETCVLIPHSLNTFLIAKRDRDLPQGVSMPKCASSRNPYKAQIKIEGEIKYLGMFPTPEAAFVVYKEVKEAEARRWASRLEAGEFVVDPRVIDRMKVWTVPSASST